MASRFLLLISSFIGAILIASISGTQYLFASYGPALAHRLKFSSVQINTIASAANYGCYLSNPLFGHISDKYGPKVSTLFASVTLFFSFLGLALTYHGSLPPLFSLCAIYLFFTGMASAAGFMAVLTTQAKNFPKIRGIALGIPLALFGLSAFIFSTIETLFFDISGWDLFRNDDAQNLFFILLLTGGVGLMYINNVGSILKSLFDTTSMVDDHEKLLTYQNFHVSLISVFSCIGRISSGFTSDLFKQTFNLRRIWFLLSASILLLSGQIIVGFFITHLETLWIGSMIVGLGFGNLLGIAPTIASEWFGLRRFGLNWGFLSYSVAIGGQLYSLVFGFHRDWIRHKCSGVNCYTHVFWFTSTTCLLSVSLIIRLFWNRYQRRNEQAALLFSSPSS
ncbi:6345_t:CDS:2 [Ambispora leptoticha]|uniref:6345_t:CDS:1 n=1 Tax=Ambispora leptoticha TaxID=144679 RepID=A0A9N9A7C8_9GLOM|nr:6345_t:CDS:2 [Ambispora leptoticha]